MQKLLTLLSDNHFHSGEELGQVLGITRAAVWKKLKALEGLGLHIDSVRGKGYRLSPDIELLDHENITEQLELAVKNKVALHTCLSTGSTNDLVQELVFSSSRKQHFCTAEYQTRGRGRRGRNWSNPFGSTICLSALWKVGEGMASLEGLSLAVGVVVIQALESIGCQGLKLKWPNDVLWQSPEGYKKLAGILLEVHGDPNGECKVIIGVGLNAALSQEQLTAIGQPATDLQRICGRVVSRNRAVSALINHISTMLDQYGEEGFDAFRECWSRYDAFSAQTVTVDASGKQVIGIARGVSEQGGLLLETDSGMMTFNGGEVSLRKR